MAGILVAGEAEGVVEKCDVWDVGVGRFGWVEVRWLDKVMGK